MGVTYLLIFVVIFHLYLFRKLIFNWNVFAIFFISNLIFSLVGVLAFPFLREYVYKVFWTFKLKEISESAIIETQVLVVIGMLIALYSYAFMMVLRYRKVKCINHIKIKEPIEDNISRSNYYFALLIIGLFLFLYVIINRNILQVGLFDGLIGRDPEALLKSRRGITSNYFYVIITYNLLPFLSIVAFYISLNKKTAFNKLTFWVLFLTSIMLILLLFQKRPLLLFLLTFILAAFIFKKHLRSRKKKKPKTRKQIRRRMIFYGALLFSLLMVLYYSATTYKFDSLYEGALKLTEVSLTRVFGRLSMPSFLYVQYFPEFEGHYGFRNIGLLSKVLRFELYGDTKVLFTHYSINSQKDGNVAVGSLMDFYGAFGYYGILFGSMILGAFLGVLDIALDKLKKNALNIVFIVFCFVFAYYLSQASFARSLMGYGFFFFTLIWLWLQKGFKIKLKS